MSVWWVCCSALSLFSAALPLPLSVPTQQPPCLFSSTAPRKTQFTHRGAVHSPRGGKSVSSWGKPCFPPPAPIIPEILFWRVEVSKNSLAVAQSSDLWTLAADGAPNHPFLATGFLLRLEIQRPGVFFEFWWVGSAVSLEALDDTAFSSKFQLE